MACNYMSLTLMVIGLVAVSLGSPVAFGPNNPTHEIDQAGHSAETDMDDSDFFYNPYQHFGHGFGYGFNYPNVPFGRAGFPGVLRRAVPPVPYLFRK